MQTAELISLGNCNHLSLELPRFTWPHNSLRSPQVVKLQLRIPRCSTWGVLCHIHQVSQCAVPRSEAIAKFSCCYTPYQMHGSKESFEEYTNFFRHSCPIMQICFSWFSILAKACKNHTSQSCVVRAQEIHSKQMYIQMYMGSGRSSFQF